MDERDTLSVLQSDIVIPEIVQEKANMAFQEIRETNAVGRREQTSNQIQRRRKPRMRKRGVIIFVAAAVLALGSITVLAAYQSWSKSFSEEFRISEEQKEELQEEGAVAFAMQSQTQNGVTVTAQQSITDNYFAHLSFRVEGYDLPKDAQGNYAEPCFEHINITINGVTDYNMLGGSFYDGLVVGPEGRVVYADGSPIDYDAPGSLSRYVQDDGSLEYLITLYDGEKGYFLNKEVSVELENLGTVSKAEYLKEHEVAGKWSFQWNLQGTDSRKEYILNEPLGDTGATVTRAEISPISMHVEYNFPYQTYTETGYDQDGNPIESEQIVEAPPLAGVKLKDGTLYQYLCNGGAEGYNSDDKNTYVATYANDRVIDTSEVAYLVFRKMTDGLYSESDFYFVPVN
ncbi:MAG: DUF4179 domain-containing protein [Lachnospiraceae bacterium]|nr:DUF4179 domain-containing protein [Lachnospiraceae bacterium]